jgi:hypothetical protein
MHLCDTCCDLRITELNVYTFTVSMVSFFDGVFMMVMCQLICSADLLVGQFIDTILKLRGIPEKMRLWSVVAWLFNPFTFTIGTRQNCEPIVCAVILWILICLMKGVSSKSLSLFSVIATFVIKLRWINGDLISRIV